MNLFDAKLSIADDVLQIQCPVSFNFGKNQKVSKVENRIFLMRGPTASQWFYKVKESIQKYCPSQKSQLISDVAVKHRLSKMYSKSHQNRSAILITQFDQFAKLFAAENENTTFLNNQYIQNIRLENMEEACILRQLRNVLLDKKHVFFEYLTNHCAKWKKELETIQGEISSDLNNAPLRAFAKNFCSFCTYFGNFIVHYFEEEQVFIDYYPMDDLYILIRELLLSHFDLYERIWELYILFFGKKDALMYEKILKMQSVSMVDIG